jgi:hypothetical protein
MVGVAVLCGIRIRYTRLPAHLIGGNLAVGIEEGGESSDRCSHRVVDLIHSTYVTDLVSEDSDQFKRSMATTLALRLHEEFPIVMNNVICQLQ